MRGAGQGYGGGSQVIVNDKEGRVGSRIRFFHNNIF